MREREAPPVLEFQLHGRKISHGTESNRSYSGSG